MLKRHKRMVSVATTLVLLVGSPVFANSVDILFAKQHLNIYEVAAKDIVYKAPLGNAKLKKFTIPKGKTILVETEALITSAVYTFRERKGRNFEQVNGYQVPVILKEDFKSLEGEMILAAGTRLYIYVIPEPGKRFFRPGKVWLSLQTFELPNGSKLFLSTRLIYLENQGKPENQGKKLPQPKGDEGEVVGSIIPESPSSPPDTSIIKQILSIIFGDKIVKVAELSIKGISAAVSKSEAVIPSKTSVRILVDSATLETPESKIAVSSAQ